MVPLPAEVRGAIAEGIAAAVHATEATASSLEPIEEATSGALVSHLKLQVRGLLGDHRWRTVTTVVSKGALQDGGEKAIGADLLLELHVEGSDAPVFRKLVLVQSKKDWGRGKGGLLSQLQLLAQLPGVALVAEYSRRGVFRAMSAPEAIEALGAPGVIGKGKARPLALALGEDFLACRIGSQELVYDEDEGELVNLTTERRTRVRAKSAARVLVEHD